MNLFIAILAALGLFFVLFVTFCCGAVYENNRIAKAAQTGQPYKLAGGDCVRVTPWGGDGK